MSQFLGRPTRRAFLQSAAAAVASPIILPSLSWAQGEAPSDRIGVALVGAGKQGLMNLNGLLRNRQVRMVAVCDVDTDRRNEAKRRVDDRYGDAACAAFSDHRELLQRADVDAVMIETPDHWHVQISIDAAKAGKDLFVDKPLTHTVAEGRALADAVKAHGRVLQTGSQQRSMNEFRRACELVRHGRLGQLQLIRVGGADVPPRPCDLPGQDAPDGLDWDRWLGPAAKRPYNDTLSPRGVHDHYPHWRRYTEFGGGSVADIGTHHYDIVQWALDRDDTGPVTFHPAGEHDSGKPAFTYGDGVTVVADGPWGVTFVGEEGEIFVTRGRIEIRPESLGEEPPADAIRLRRSDNHVGNWLDSIRSREQPICDAEIGHRSATICHLLNLAILNNRVLQWDPANERITGDDDANDWLDRDRREPWTLT
jgi:predicted dehydrogenase